MLQTVVRIFQIAFLALGVAALGWFLWDKWGSDRRIELDAYRRILADRAVERVAMDIPRWDSVKRLLVMPVKGDFERHVTDMLLDELQERPDYIVVDARRYEGILTPKDAMAAIAMAKKVKDDARPDGILFSQVLLDYGRRGLGARVDLESKIVALDAEGKFPTESVRATEEITSRASLDYLEAFMEESSRLGRMAIWLFVTAGLPFAVFPVVQAVTRKENNRLNLVMLGSFTALNMTVALVLLGLRAGWFGAVLVLLAGLAGFLYNFVICDKIDEMRK